MARAKRDLIANKTGRAAAAKPDGARQYLKMCACGREFNGAPILVDYTASARCRAKKVAQKPDVESVHLYRIDKTEIFA